MNGPTDILKMRPTACHMLKNLANELYRDRGACLWELIKNGLVACMIDSWQPRHAHVEVVLHKNHPLAPGVMALEVFDKGCGIPRPRLETIGPSIDEPPKSKRNYHGAAQKRIGRFAGLSLNSRCFNDDDVNTGFYILTRTTQTGPVTMVSFIPALLEMERPVISYPDPNGIELGLRRGMKGTFTSIVIPYSVFSTDAEIREALKWLMPRKADRMFRLIIGGKEMIPPPLVSRITEPQDDDYGVEAYLDKCKEEGKGGVWLADAVTGFRVASASALGYPRIPDPLWSRDLVGDIFVPGLLENQDTSRSGLNSKFFASKEWRKALGFLIAKVVPAAKSLLGNTNVFSKNEPIDRTIRDVLDLFKEAFGEPDDQDGPPWDWVFPVPRKKPHKPVENPRGPNGPKDKDKEPKPPKPPKDPIPRKMPFKVDGETYQLTKVANDQRVLVVVDEMNDHVLNLNDRRYASLPTNKYARQEHTIMALLSAIGRHKYLDNGEEAMMWVAEQRQKLGGCQPVSE